MSEGEDEMPDEIEGPIEAKEYLDGLFYEAEGDPTAAPIQWEGQRWFVILDGEDISILIDKCSQEHWAKFYLAIQYAKDYGLTYSLDIEGAARD
jgi:hypothetical protein